MVNSFTSVGSNKTLWLTLDRAASSSTVTSFPNFAGPAKFGKLERGGGCETRAQSKFPETGKFRWRATYKKHSVVGFAGEGGEKERGRESERARE